MTLTVVPEDGNATFIINRKAFGLIAGALDHPFETWMAIKPSVMTEDDFADPQNDIGYLDILRGELKARFSNS